MHKSFICICALACIAFISSCKPSDANHQEITFVRDLSIGLYEYNAHSLNLEKVFSCANKRESYCKHVYVSSPSQTAKDFASHGWSRQILKTFLQDESYGHYKAQGKYHLMIFLFKSGSQDYVRIVNRFSKTVHTLAVTPGSVLDLDQLLSHEQLFYFESEPTLADIYIGRRKIQEAPIWVYLAKGQVAMHCKLPGRQSEVMQVSIPGEVSQKCNVLQ